MNKKIFPLFSLLLMLALAVTSFVPAHAAPLAGYSEPVNLLMSYNPTTREIAVTTAFANKDIKIGYGVVTVRNTSNAFAWVKTTRQTSVSRIAVKYVVPRGAGYYCANVQLSGIKTMPMISTGGDDPMPYQGSASKCVFVPK